MKPIRTFKVCPCLPARLEPLRKLAYNLYWDWNIETQALFQRLDRDLWEGTNHNPVLMLGTISQERLAEMARDEGFLAHLERCLKQLDNYLQERIWYRQNRNFAEQKDCYAYFCAEYGLTHCLPIYAGGLGVLAGDHLKSASDLGLPLVAIGLLYQEGYFAQSLNPDGWQQEKYPINDFYNMPLELQRNEDGSELLIEVEYPGRIVYARVWCLQVGTVPLFMLDTNIEANSSRYDQDITDELYGGDLDLRIHQEMMLGIGGVRMLEKLGYKPTVYHLNEGHSAFLILERIARLIEAGLSFTEAKQFVQSTQIFTTHTPVSAGFDRYSSEAIMHYVGSYADLFGLRKEEFLALGRENTGDLTSPFSMATLAIKHSSFINGVSQLHTFVSRKMFSQLWPEVPLSEVPIQAITNGVHARSVVAPSTQNLYDRYLGPSWDSTDGLHPLWEKVESIPDEELWRNREHRRADLVVFVRKRLVANLDSSGATRAEIERAKEVLNPNILTIGFARRFATYKRANLFLYDLARIKQILIGNRERQVQFVLAGKAHPKDLPGKELIRQIIALVREQEMRERIVFLPDYNINVARILVAGCDIWLNNPRRPQEASGTSGMKAAMNGSLNLSVLDGWWDEADYQRTGWAIGHGEVYPDPNYQDRVEANALYNLLEKEIVPLFYQRDEKGIPRGWVHKMKDAIRLNCPQFNTARMVRDYAIAAYFPASERYFVMKQNNYAPTREMARWKEAIFQHWYRIKIKSIDVSENSQIFVEQPVSVTAEIDLAALKPEDVELQLYKGKINDKGEIVDGTSYRMEYIGQDDSRSSIYQGQIVYRSSGLQGLSLRVLPKHQNLSSPYELGLILWPESNRS